MGESLIDLYTEGQFYILQYLKMLDFSLIKYSQTYLYVCMLAQIRETNMPMCNTYLMVYRFVWLSWIFQLVY